MYKDLAEPKHLIENIVGNTYGWADKTTVNRIMSVMVFVYKLGQKHENPKRTKGI